MFYGVSHVAVPVGDLQRAQRFYVEWAGFRLVREGSSSLDVDAGTVILRLLQADARLAPKSPITVWLGVKKVDETAQLLVRAGGQLVQSPHKEGENEWVATIADPDENRLILWRRLNEDELGFTPELPKSVPWRPEADTLLQTLLESVPVLLRDSVRRRATSAAEALTLKDRPVVSVDAVRGFIRAVPSAMRFRCKDALLAKGYNPDEFLDDFES